jgi:hypothetical protein
MKMTLPRLAALGGVIAALAALLFLVSTLQPSSAQVGEPEDPAPPAPEEPAAPPAPAAGSFDLTQNEPFTGLEYTAAPSSIRDDVPLVVRRPAPSDVDERLLGPVQLVKSAQFDEEAGTVTLPLREGRMADGEPVWYVITDTSDEGISELLGVNYSAKLIYADIERGVRRAVVDGDGVVEFEQGRVDFAPEFVLEPGEDAAFPPARAEPGSVGDEFYTPLFKTTNANEDVVYNGPVLAQGATAEQLNAMCGGDVDLSVVHDKVVSICPEDGTVELRLTLGYSFAKPLWYVSFDANTELAATLEGSTLTPVYDALGIRLEDAAIGSGLERLLIFTNGDERADSPDRQGLGSAITNGRDPINVFGGIPTVNLDYSPLWDAMLLQWTDDAVEQGYSTRIIDAFQALQYETRGHLTGPEGGPVESSGIVINCPVFLRFN